MAQGKQNKGQQQSKKKTNKRTHRMTPGEIVRYTASLTERKLRRTLRSCGPKFAHQWVQNREAHGVLVRLAKQPTKIGNLAKMACGKS